MTFLCIWNWRLLQKVDCLLICIGWLWSKYIKYLSIVNWMLYCYKSCTFSKTIHYRTGSGLNICPSILHTVMQPGRKIQYASWRSQFEQRQNYLQFVVPLYQVFLGLTGRLPRWPSPPTKPNHSVGPSYPLHLLARIHISVKGFHDMLEPELHPYVKNLSKTPNGKKGRRLFCRCHSACRNRTNPKLMFQRHLSLLLRTLARTSPQVLLDIYQNKFPIQAELFQCQTDRQTDSQKSPSCTRQNSLTIYTAS